MLPEAETIIFEQPIIKHKNPKRKIAPLQSFNAKKFMKNAGNSYDVQFIKQVPIYPRDRLARRTKEAQSNDAGFLKTLQETKNIFENLKTDPKSTLFSEDKINNKVIKKLKNSRMLETSSC